MRFFLVSTGFSHSQASSPTWSIPTRTNGPNQTRLGTLEETGLNCPHELSVCSPASLGCSCSLVAVSFQFDRFQFSYTRVYVTISGAGTPGNCSGQYADNTLEEAYFGSSFRRSVDLSQEYLKQTNLHLPVDITITSGSNSPYFLIFQYSLSFLRRSPHSLS